MTLLLKCVKTFSIFQQDLISGYSHLVLVLGTELLVDKHGGVQAGRC